MSETYDNAERHMWEYSADWCEDNRPHFRTGIVHARNLAEAEELAKQKTHPTANVYANFSGWNR